jgi:short-subunit dehydrogenase
MIDINAKALVLITHAVIPYMEKGGRIIELGSGSCFTPLPYFNVYAASKSFVLHYTKALNYEIKHLGIRATCFCPGWVDTEFLGIADTGDVTVPKKTKPLLRVEDVVRRCIKASLKGRAMCVTNWYTKLQHLLFKIMPDCILSRAWLGMLKHPENKSGQ